MQKLPIIYKLGIAIILLLPAVSHTAFFSPPPFGQTIVFKIIFSILLFLFCYQSFFSRRKDIYKRILGRLKAKKNLLFYLPAILLGVLTVATIFSKDPLFSVFGDPERGGGFLNFGMMILFSYLLILLLNKKEWKYVWNTSFIVGAGVAVFGIIQWAGIFERVTSSSRPFSTLGNPTVLALYLLLLLFPLIAFFVREKNKTIKWLYLSGILLFSFVIILTYTRASLLGMFVGLIYLFLFYPQKGKVLFSLRIATLILIVIASSFVYFSNTDSKPTVIEENKVLSGLSNRLTIDRAVRDPRVGGFLIGWEAIKERPLLGYGPENFAIAFNQHYHPGMPYISRDIPWWDKAHNLLIEMWIWGGILAVTTVLLLFGLLFKFLHKERNPENHILQAGLIAFFVANMFTIDLFTVYLLFFVLCGYIISKSIKEEEFSSKQEKKEVNKRERISKYKTPFVVISVPLLIIFVYSFNILPLLANKNIQQAKAYQTGDNCPLALEAVNRATQYSTVIDSYIHRFEALIKERCLEMDRESAEEIHSVLNKIREKRPMHVQSLNNLASFIINNLKYFEEDEKQEMILEAKEVLEEIKEISPNRYEIHLQEARIHVNSGDYQSAYQSADTCVLIRRDENCLFFRAVAGAALNKDTVEDDLIAAEEREFDVKETSSINTLINAYAEAENYEQIIPLYKELIEMHPDNLQYYSSIATTYRELGDYKNAKEYALKILEIEPDAAMLVHDFLETLPQ